MVRRKRDTKPARRKKGTGSVYQRKSDGRWALEWDDLAGNHYIDYASTREEATAILDAHIAKIKAGEFVAPDRITVESWLLEWYANIKSPGYRPNPRYNSKSIITARLIPAIGTIEVQKLTSRELAELVGKWIKEGLAPNTICRYFCLLRVALDDACKHGIIKENPCNAVTLPRVLKKKRPALTLDQAQLFLIEIADYWLETWVILAVGTGMRIGEIGALKWEDIDFKAGMIHVHRNVAYLPTGHEEGIPKTEAGTRDIAMPDFVRDALLDHRKKQLNHRSERIQNGLSWIERRLVLPRDDGDYRSPEVVNKILKDRLRRARLPVISFHCLRHSAVRIMQALGIPIEVISKILGHSSIKVTADIYGDVSSDMQQGAMSTYNAAFQKGKRRAN